MTEYDDLIDLYLFSSGRRQFAWKQLLESAAIDEGLQAQVRESLEAEAEIHELERQWRAFQRGGARRSDPSMSQARVQVDRSIARVLDGLVDTIKGFIKGLREDATLAELVGDEDEATREQRERQVARAEELIHELFPNGVRSITQLEYEDQLARVHQIVAAMTSDYGDVVDGFQLTPIVGRLKRLNDHFEQLLKATDPPRLSYKTVRNARDRGQRNLLKTVAIILGTYHRDEQSAVRAALLQPILTQNDEIAEYHQERQPVVDVNPDTGVPEPETDVFEPEGDTPVEG